VQREKRVLIHHEEKAPLIDRRKLSALASFFDALCERNAVKDNPVHGVERPKASNYEGLTPALSDA
jgi:site-specific recombinase XerC